MLRMGPLLSLNRRASSVTKREKRNLSPAHTIAFRLRTISARLQSSHPSPPTRLPRTATEPTPSPIRHPHPNGDIPPHENHRGDVVLPGPVPRRVPELRRGHGGSQLGEQFRQGPGPEPAVPAVVRLVVTDRRRRDRFDSDGGGRPETGGFQPGAGEGGGRGCEEVHRSNIGAGWCRCRCRWCRVGLVWDVIDGIRYRWNLVWVGCRMVEELHPVLLGSYVAWEGYEPSNSIDRFRLPFFSKQFFCLIYISLYIT